jgi:hypothetical protein
MAIVHLTEASASAPRLSGTNGDLCAVLDWALVQNGWAIEFTASNARVYRPGSGNRFRLFVQHDSAVSGNAGLAVVRGCENASAAAIGSLTDQFPQVAQIAASNSNWITSSAASTTSRNFDIFVAPTWVIYCVNFSGSTNVWEWHFFGDISPAYSGEAYNTLCAVRNNTGVASPVMFTSTVSSSTTGLPTIWWARSYDGTVKSTRGCINSVLGSSVTMGVVTGVPAIFLGPSTSLDSQKCQLFDSGNGAGAVSATLALIVRGWLPNIRQPLHNGRQSTTPNARDTYTDTAYNASFLGTVFTQSNGANSGTLVVEGDTWAPPSG